MARRTSSGPAVGTLGDRAQQCKRAFASAVRSLARRPRTKAEIEAFLSQREYPGDVIAQTVERLQELAYLDEAAVADVIVREAERRNLGSRKVAQTLSRRGVPGELAEAARRQTEQGDLARARALLSHRYPQGVEDGPRPREQAVRLLVRRGFPYAIARQAIGMDIDVGI